jgi:3-hydroxyisobutyrate dehydrogenase-like beta-hydroxyacid dehydrogenase
MQMAMIGLGRMGANMARRLRRGGIEVVGYNRNQEVVTTWRARRGCCQPLPWRRRWPSWSRRGSCG